MLTSGQFNYMDGHCQEIHVKHYPPSRKTVHVIVCVRYHLRSSFFCQFVSCNFGEKNLAACEMRTDVLKKSTCKSPWCPWKPRQVSWPLCVSLCMFFFFFGAGELVFFIQVCIITWRSLLFTWRPELCLKVSSWKPWVFLWKKMCRSGYKNYILCYILHNIVHYILYIIYNVYLHFDVRIMKPSTFFYRLTNIVF